MIYHIYDHNFAPWRNRVKRINGAWTYSIDICKYYLPYLEKTVIDEYGEQPIVISTCAPLHKYPPKDLLDYSGRFGVLVQFLHSYPYTDPIEAIKDTVLKFGRKFDKIVFVVAYKQYADEINQVFKESKVVAKYLPMRIGVLPDAQPKAAPKPRAVWFGNVYNSKRSNYRKVKESCDKRNIELITINGGRLYSIKTPQGKSITQQQAWEYCADSDIVFAVGRCALECYHMGCHVVIIGDKFGGLVTSDSDWQLQEATNFNGRIQTGEYNLPQAIDVSMERSSQYQFQPPNKIHCSTLVSLDKLLWQ